MLPFSPFTDDRDLILYNVIYCKYLACVYFGGYPTMYILYIFGKSNILTEKPSVSILFICGCNSLI